MLTNSVKQERDRIEYMLKEYSRRLEGYPKGTLSERHVGTKTYYYLKYRSGKKVISDYVTREEYPELMEKLEHKKHIKTMIRFLKGELALADKLLGRK
ncbi:MAG: hypothetical protein IJR19_09650 [Lachnospiraceae bacterium]|nr:hypothetical protein [Lachnospiraceae bacterium]MBQ7261611.1 hypothetical protein [Lachnospiraceae bacterium]